MEEENLDGQNKTVDRARYLVAKGVPAAYLMHANPYWMRYIYADETIGLDLAQLQGSGADLRHALPRVSAFHG